MQQATLPVSRDLVLIGGGHTHALVLRRFGMTPLPGCRITLINPGPKAPYSGMLPGHLAGHYPRSALDIDLVRLARFAGARLVMARATGIDLDRRIIRVENRPAIGFDVASIDIGITSAMPDIPGFAEHAIPAKPLDAFAEAWGAFRSTRGAASLAVIGGGVAGVEIALALAHALRRDGRAARITVVDSATLLSALPAASARRLRHAMKQYGIDALEGARIAEIDQTGLRFEDGTRRDVDLVVGAAGARPYDWLSDTGLALSQGFIAVDGRLQSSDEAVFAAGDCAQMTSSPRPKAGVFAVRQAPILEHNLRARLVGQGGLRRYKPQRDYLKLVSLGDRAALADRFGLSLSGRWLWRWKDRIDRRFMAQFRALPQMPEPSLPWPRAAGSRAALGTKPLCGGCGAKLSRGALQAALFDGEQIGDDAATLDLGAGTQVMSSDHLRGFTEDPYILARVAAIHAWGDIWAMGARPRAATLSVILPRQSDALSRRALSEIVAAATEVCTGAGADLVGGHSSFGAELTVGLCVIGTCARPPVTLGNARPGDALILTKPLGSGLLMAAEMAGRADGADIERALEWMMQPQGRAAEILADAHAMTDVTGFGLAGHLRNLCDASGLGAVLEVDAVPMMPGALALAEAGMRASLFDENRASWPDCPSSPRTDLLFDPQTAGGLLAALPQDGAEAVLDALHKAGFEAARIGHMTAEAGQLTLA